MVPLLMASSSNNAKVPPYQDTNYTALNVISQNHQFCAVQPSLKAESQLCIADSLALKAQDLSFLLRSESLLSRLLHQITVHYDQSKQILLPSH